jgi:hypothetical protein
MTDARSSPGNMPLFCSEFESTCLYIDWPDIVFPRYDGLQHHGSHIGNSEIYPWISDLQSQTAFRLTPKYFPILPRPVSPSPSFHNVWQYSAKHCQKYPDRKNAPTISPHSAPRLKNVKSVAPGLIQCRPSQIGSVHCFRFLKIPFITSLIIRFWIY